MKAREAEMLQAIDRLRLIYTAKRKTVYILVTWKQLTGDGRLSDALAECDARGWNALPLAAKKNDPALPRSLEGAAPPQRHIEI
jgi:hypothetical protein